MRPSPPGSGTLFITQPQAKKKPSPSAQESGAQQNLLVHTRASPHRQAHASVLTVAATLECCYRLIDGKALDPTSLLDQRDYPFASTNLSQERCTKRWATLAC